MILRSSLLTLMIILLDWSRTIAQPPLVMGQDKGRQCKSIALVVSGGDQVWKAGSRLCEGDRLQPTKGTKVKVVCTKSRQVYWLGSGVVSEQCGQQEAQPQIQRCTPQNQSNCPRRKGPGVGRNQPTLLTPYGSVILNARPLLSWDSVDQANSYTVQVNGKDVNWARTVSGTSLSYPKSEPALPLGNAYEVSIIAKRNGSPVSRSSASSSVIIVPSENELQQIITTVRQIKNLNLPPDEEALNLDIVYASQNLLTESINTLQARIHLGSQNSTIYRLLGDRYLEAGLLDNAKQKYTTAAKLAQKADNSAELAKARDGLKRAELYSQLPINTNPAQ